MFEKILKAITSLFSGEPGAGTVILVKTAYSPDGKHRVCFFTRKEDGIYGFREEVYEDRTMDACWVPMKHGHVEEYRTMDDAIASARAEVPWLPAAMP
jgi:hypothetical protein